MRKRGRSASSVNQVDSGASASSCKKDFPKEKNSTMERRGRQMSRKRKTQMPEEDEKQNELILEEVHNISGKSVEASVEKDGSPPARLKRSASKPKEKAVTQPKKVNAKKLPVSPQSLPPSKQKKSTGKVKRVNAVGNNNKTSTCLKGIPVPHLPGWRREVSVRKSGRTAGKIDIYFYSPEGIKLRSRPDISSYLDTKEIFDIKVEEFDFSKKVTEAGGKKNALGNSTAQGKKGKIQQKKKVVKAEMKNSSKAVSAKKSRSPAKSSTKVPPPADTGEKNDADGKSNTVLIKILESKPKKSRK